MWSIGARNLWRPRLMSGRGPFMGGTRTEGPRISAPILHIYKPVHGNMVFWWTSCHFAGFVHGKGVFWWTSWGFGQFVHGFGVFGGWGKEKQGEKPCFVSGWLDSNERPLRPERSALPTALHPDLYFFFDLFSLFLSHTGPLCSFEKSNKSLKKKCANFSNNYLNLLLQK